MKAPGVRCSEPILSRVVLVGIVADRVAVAIVTAGVTGVVLVRAVASATVAAIAVDMVAVVAVGTRIAVPVRVDLVVEHRQAQVVPRCFRKVRRRISRLLLLRRKDRRSRRLRATCRIRHATPMLRSFRRW